MFQAAVSVGALGPGHYIPTPLPGGKSSSPGLFQLLTLESSLDPAPECWGDPSTKKGLHLQEVLWKTFYTKDPK